MVDQVRKRDGRLEAFNQEKITDALSRAFTEVRGKKEQAASRRISDQVVATLEERFAGSIIPSVEEIQDLVEDTLIKSGYGDVAKAYILYRNRHALAREYKRFFGVADDLKLGVNAIKVLQRRYLRRDPGGNVVETPSQMFRRVARMVASIDEKSEGKPDVKLIEERFYRIMAELAFLPNTPTLMNAGTSLGQLSACFVIPIQDSLESIFDAVKATAMIHKTGGGTGFSFSRLRPQGDIVKTNGGPASGPISFMKIFDATTEEIKQGGKRRGANMAVLSVHHPDIVDFVTAKSRANILQNFNLSVAVDDEFMRAAERGKSIDLVNPRNHKTVKRVSARDLLSLMVTKAWETGDPGLLFIDEINRRNPTPRLGTIEATNPCGEVPLLPYESCNLGSINLTNVVVDGRIDWEKLTRLVRDAVHFLDNIIDGNRYPLKKIERVTKGNRKIGLGVMGFAEMLILLGIRYDSEQAVATARRVMRFIDRASHEASEDLAKRRGSFPNFAGSVWEKRGFSRMRNATTTTIAPTGTISIIAGCSSGIEPLFAISFVRDVMEGTRLLEVNPLFEEIARKRGFYSSQLMMKIAQNGSVKEIQEVPQDVKHLFVTALDIAPEWHIRIQAAFQEFTDNAVSKTINIPHDASAEEVKESFLLAWKLKCKGITVYRYGSKPQQVLYIGAMEKGAEEKHVVADSEFAGGCAGTVCPT